MKKLSLLFLFSAVLIFCACAQKAQVQDFSWYSNAAFVKAIETSDLERAQGLLYTNKIDLNVLNKEGQSALLYALANTENDKIIEAIAGAGADLNITDEAGRTPLRIAAHRVKNQKVFLALLRSGAALGDTQTLLDDAAQNPNPQVLEIAKEATNKTPWFKNAAFIEAVKANNFQGVLKELPFTDINAQTPQQTTAFLGAIALLKDVNIVNLLIKNTANINVLYEGKTPALVIAAMNVQSPQVFEAYLKAGLNANQASAEGVTPLLAAILKNPNAPTIAKMLVDAGADINVQTQAGETPLMLAVKNPNPILANFLLSTKKADLKKTNKEGKTALHIAAQFNSNENLTQALIDAGADVNASDQTGNTPFILSAFNTNHLVSQVLFNAGAKTDAKNLAGETALSIAAAKNKNPKVSLMILNAMKAVEEPSKILVLAGTNPNPEVYERLSEMMPYKASLNANNSKNYWYESSPFKAAVEANDTAALKKVLSKGINLNALQPGPVGISALMFAAARSTSSEVIYTLVRAGADVSIRNQSGDTALSVAALVSTSPSVISALISAGADVNSKDNSGISVLAVAAASNKSEQVVMALLKNGAKGKKEVMLKYADKNPNKRVKGVLENGL